MITIPLRHNFIMSTFRLFSTTPPKLNLSGCVTSMVGLWLTFLLSDPAADDDAAVYARVPAVLEAEAGLAQAGPGERPRSVEPAAKDAPSALSESKWQKLVTAAGVRRWRGVAVYGCGVGALA